MTTWAPAEFMYRYGACNSGKKHIRKAEVVAFPAFAARNKNLEAFDETVAFSPAFPNAAARKFAVSVTKAQEMTTAKAQGLRRSRV